MNDKTILFAFLLLLMPWRTVAQDYDADMAANRAVTGTMSREGTLSMTFTSETEVKFFLYVNGKLQNTKSTGRLTVNGLMDKDYHIRIVMDDPFEISTTRTMRPGKGNTEYAVRFNPVREYIYINRRKETVQQGEWYNNAGATNSSYNKDNAAARKQENKSERQTRKERKEEELYENTTGNTIKTTKTPYLEE